MKNEIVELNAKLAAMETELSELRAYKEAAEKQEPAPADKPERITEQDARVLVESAMHHYIFNDQSTDIDVWFNEHGRGLLNKLNADREQVPAVAVPDDHMHVSEFIDLCQSFSSRTGSIYIGDVESALSGYLSAANTFAPSHSQQSAEAENVNREDDDAIKAAFNKVDIDNQIIEMFRSRGVMIESGSQFSVRGQIAQLLDVVKPIIAERDEALEKLAAMETKAKQLITRACCNAVEKLTELAPNQGWDSGEVVAEMYVRQLSDKPVPADKPAVDWPKINELVTGFIDDYHYAGDGGYYCPNDWEKALITDCIVGLLDELPLTPAVVVPDEWRGSLKEMVQAMRDYEMDVGEPAPGKHRAMMDRAETLLAAPSHIQKSSDIDGFVKYLRDHYRMDVSEQRDEYLKKLSDRCPSHESEQGGDQ